MAALCQVPGAQGPASVACLAPRPGAPLEASLSLFFVQGPVPATGCQSRRPEFG